jgi:hypothetical protein
MMASNLSAIPDRLALVGGMGAGKSHVAGILAQHGWYRLSFATPLKAAARALMPEPSRDLLQALSEVTRNVEPRPLLTIMADNLSRLDETAAFERQPINLVIDDVRFPDEVVLLQDAGFTVMRVVAPDELRWRRCTSNGRAQSRGQFHHPSELALKSHSFPEFRNHRPGSPVGLNDQELLKLLGDAASGGPA